MGLLAVKFDSVADHALPLARWADRMLWGWSPWHLRAQCSAAQRQADHWFSEASGLARDIRAVRRELRNSEARRKEMVKYVSRPSLLPIVPYDGVVEHCPSRRSSRIVFHPRMLALEFHYMDWKNLCRVRDMVDYIKREMRPAVLAEVDRMVDEAVARA